MCPERLKSVSPLECTSGVWGYLTCTYAPELWKCLSHATSEIIHSRECREYWCVISTLLYHSLGFDLHLLYCCFIVHLHLLLLLALCCGPLLLNLLHQPCLIEFPDYIHFVALFRPHCCLWFDVDDLKLLVQAFGCLSCLCPNVLFILRENDSTLIYCQ